MSTNKQNIYAASYTMKPKDNTKSLEELREWKAKSERQKLGILLREEKSKGKKLQQKINRLNEENRRLREAIALKARDAHPNDSHHQR
jgi:cell shape-determining protein MreC